MGILIKNNARSELSADITASATSLTVADASAFPGIGVGTGDSFYLTIVEGDTIEIVKVTATSGSTLTVVRAQDGTSASSFSSGDAIELRMNKAALDARYAKLDGIGKFAFGNVSSTSINSTSPVTLIESSVPSAGVTVGQHVTASFTLTAYNSTSTMNKNHYYQIRQELKSKNTAGIALGTGTYVSSPSQYNGWWYVSGNKTDIISPGRGKVATTSSGSNSGAVFGCYYDGTNDRTYIRVGITAYNTAYQNVEMYYSIDSFTGQNSWVVQNNFYNSRYVSLQGTSRLGQDVTINDFLGRQSSATTFRIQFDHVSSTSGWTFNVMNFSGTVENVQ
jgi:hypothetical protein